MLLAGVTCLGFALMLLFLRRESWRHRQHDLARLQRNNDELQHLIWLSSRISPRRPLPLRTGWEARPGALNAAWELIRSERPARVLELGSGLSSLVMAYALEANGAGQLQALEDHEESATATRLLLTEHQLQHCAQVLDAPLSPLELNGTRCRWYSLSQLSSDSPVDLLFVDGPAGDLAPMVRFPALPLLRDYLAEGAIILVDDTDREQERQMIERWLGDYPGLQLDHRFCGESHMALRLNANGV